MPEFEMLLRSLDLQETPKKVAAGVSGGPDSMAMLRLLSMWGEKQGIDVHAFTVDHGLRPEAAHEARQVAAWVQAWPRVQHDILKWEGEKPQTRILEEARTARYALLKKAAMAAGASLLFIAHHRDDQAETFLIRLAKGSGLDGLSCMNPFQKDADGFAIVRPLLDMSKEELIVFCQSTSTPYIEDPTNRNEDYLRPRLRAAKAVLEEEGLSAKRLSQTAKRMARARRALEALSMNLFEESLIEQKPDGYLFNWQLLQKSPEELVLRVLSDAMERISPKKTYGPRMEKVESLLSRLFEESDFKSATLGGCLFAKEAKNGTLWIGKEF